MWRRDEESIAQLRHERAKTRLFAIAAGCAALLAVVALVRVSDDRRTLRSIRGLVQMMEARSSAAELDNARLRANVDSLVAQLRERQVEPRLPFAVTPAPSPPTTASTTTTSPARPTTTTTSQPPPSSTTTTTPTPTPCPTVPVVGVCRP